MDVHIPIAVTEGLRRREVDVLTAQEDGASRATDEALLQRAVESNRLLVTQDEDFFAIASDWQETRRTFPGIVFAPQIGISIGRLVEDLELVAKCGNAAELRDLITNLPLR
jgi:hypothetical protein